MKVLKTFYCIQEGRSYYKGDEYKGKRTDLLDYLEVEIEVVKPKRKKKK